jgi:hypothetical protein
MRRVLANALLTAGLLAPLFLYAQPRGGPRASFAASRGSFRGFVTPPRMRPMARQSQRAAYSAPFRITFPPVTGTSLINPGQASCIPKPSYSNSFYCRQYFPYGAYYNAEPVYPSWMPSMGYDTDQAPAPAPAPEQEPDAQLSDQVGNLAAQVEMMREEQAQRYYPGPATPAAPEEEEPPVTVLVYRDGREVEVHNYAIIGKTVWVFSDQTARQVPLADLDLPSTERVNAARGVDFDSHNP